MRTFFDDENREWRLHLTWAKAEEIYQPCERPDSTPQARKTFDLFNLTDKEQIEYFVTHDPVTGRFNLKNGERLVNILYVLCEQQCAERGISDREFGEMLMSSMFSRAWEAMQEELGNFIQDPTRREIFQTLMYLAEGNQRAALSAANQTLTKAKTALDALMLQRTTEAGELMEKAIRQATETLEKAAEESTMTNSSNSAESSESSQTTSP